MFKEIDSYMQQHESCSVHRANASLSSATSEDIAKTSMNNVYLIGATHNTDSIEVEVVAEKHVWRTKIPNLNNVSGDDITNQVITLIQLIFKTGNAFIDYLVDEATEISPVVEQRKGVLCLR